MKANAPPVYPPSLPAPDTTFVTLKPDVSWRIELVTVAAAGPVDESITTGPAGSTVAESHTHDGSPATGGATSVAASSPTVQREPRNRSSTIAAGPSAVSCTVPATAGSLPYWQLYSMAY